MKQSKINSQLKYNSVNDKMDDIESSIYSQISGDIPKEIYYLPQKVTNSNTIPKNIPKLNLLKNKNQDENMNSDHQKESEIADLNFGSESRVEELSPGNLNQAFINIESLTMSEKKEDISDVENDKEEKSSTKPSSKKNFALNLENIPRADYHTEFIAKYDEFSPSWRKECRNMKGFVPKENN